MGKIRRMECTQIESIAAMAGMESLATVWRPFTIDPTLVLIPGE